MPARTKTEREMWRWLHAPTKAAAARRGELDKSFAFQFPRGHEESGRTFLEFYLAKKDTDDADLARVFRYMKGFHPDAFEVLLAYGEDYVPVEMGDAIVKDRNQPKPKQCYLNSWELLHWFARTKEADSPPMRYVEGLVLGAVTAPMLHAWDTVHTGGALDWTHYATTRWSRYFGIPFTKDEYIHIVGPKGTSYPVHLLFHADHFERVRGRLLEVLSSRKEEIRKPAA